MARQSPGHVAHASVDVKRSATDLAGGDDYIAAVLLQHADGGLVQLRKGHLLHAAGEEGHAGAAFTLGGEDPAKLGEEEAVVDARQELFRGTQLAQLAQQPGAAHERLRAGALVETQQAGNQGEAARVGQQVAQAERAQQP